MRTSNRWLPLWVALVLWVVVAGAPPTARPCSIAISPGEEVPPERFAAFLGRHEIVVLADITVVETVPMPLPPRPPDEQYRPYRHCAECRATLILREIFRGGAAGLSVGDTIVFADSCQCATQIPQPRAVAASGDTVFDVVMGLVMLGDDGGFRLRPNSTGAFALALVDGRWRPDGRDYAHSAEWTDGLRDAAARLERDSRQDLDGDGRPEPIAVTFHTGEYELLDRFTVTVGAASLDKNGRNLQGTFEVVDLDGSDGVREILVRQIGVADGCCYLFGYEGERIVDLGTIPGSDPVIDGSGRIRTEQLGSTLPNWRRPAEYRRTAAGRLEEVPRDLHPYGHLLRLCCELVAYADRDAPATARRFPAGECVLVVGSDDRQWCLLRTEEQWRGWFRCCGGVVGGIEAAEAFSGWDPQDTARTFVLRQDLPLYADTKGDGPSAVVNAGATVSLLSSLDGPWLELRTSGGTRGWVHAREGRFVGGHRISEVFPWGIGCR